MFKVNILALSPISGSIPSSKYWMAIAVKHFSALLVICSHPEKAKFVCESCTSFLPRNSRVFKLR
jgi:hypothetical protein